MLRILPLLALFLSVGIHAFSLTDNGTISPLKRAETERADGQNQPFLNPYFDITFHPVTCPEGNDGLAEITVINPDINPIDLMWELTTDSPDLIITLEDNFIKIAGLDYMTEHCISFTSAEDVNFQEEFCFQNDQLLDQTVFGASTIEHSGGYCSYVDTGVIILGFESLLYEIFENSIEAFDFSVVNTDSEEEIQPYEIVHVSGPHVLLSISPWSNNMEVTWSLPSSGCSWSHTIQNLTVEYTIPEEVELEILDQNLAGAELLITVSDDSENWTATFNGNPVDQFPYEVFVETNGEATLELCHPETPYCCRTFDLTYPDYVPPILGCMDEASCTFDPNATEDDGSCLYDVDCGDIDGDGLTNTDDLLLLLSNFGQSGPSLDGDFNSDQLVNTIDLLQFLVFFG